MGKYYYYYVSYPEAQKIKEVISMILSSGAPKEAKESARAIKVEIENVRPDVRYRFGGYQVTLSKKYTKVFEDILEICQIAMQRVERGE